MTEKFFASKNDNKKSFIYMGIIVVIVVVIVFVLGSRKELVLESAQSIGSATNKIITNNSSIVELIKDNDDSIEKLRLLIEELKNKVIENEDLEPILDIVSTEYNLLIMKNEQMKELLLENESLTYDAGVDMVFESFVEGSNAQNASISISHNANIQSTREEAVESISAKLNNAKVTEVPHVEVLEAINKVNGKSLNMANKITHHVKNTNRVTQRARRSLDEINKQRAAMGKPIIDKDSIATRKQRNAERKLERMNKKLELKAARDEFTNEKDPIKRKSAKSRFLMLLQKYKNRNKIDNMEEEKIADDEQALTAGEDERVTKPVTDVVSVIENNSSVAKNIDAEIIIKEKIIMDAITKVEEGSESPAEIIQDLVSKVPVDAELTDEEKKLMDEVGI